MLLCFFQFPPAGCRRVVGRGRFGGAVRPRWGIRLTITPDLW
nr:MAG TPA: hypothetical protein [Caudoviricetes sp.]